MIKKYNELINYSQEDEDYEDEQDSQMVLVGWTGYKEHWDHDDYVYLFQEIIDKDTVIVYKDKRNTVSDINYTILSDWEIQEYIYTNKKRITICDQNLRYYKHVYFNDLPKEIRNQL